MSLGPLRSKRAPEAATTIETNDILCPVCLDVPTGSILLCRNGHSVCEACLQQLVMPKRCPECRERFADKPPHNVVLEKVIGNAVLPCQYPGCEFAAKPSDLALHKWQCPFRPVRCYHIVDHGCNADVPVANFKEHMRERHALRQRSVIGFAIYEAHLDHYRGVRTFCAEVDKDFILVTVCLLYSNLLRYTQSEQARSVIHIRIFHAMQRKACTVEIGVGDHSICHNLHSEPLMSRALNADDRSVGVFLHRNSLLQLGQDQGGRIPIQVRFDCAP